jgi:hypothetical protein
MPTPSELHERIATVLLAVSAVSLTGLGVCAWGWYRAATAPVTPAELSAAARLELVEAMVATSPGVHRWSWFEPRIGYTLRPDAELTAWGDTFRSNALGYRTGSPEKAPGTFRVLFVGDSWSYGMGLREAESFPKVFERLAEEHAGLDRRVEAWNLALPGYNTLNQTAALDYFFERLAPDAVVISPTGNDNHSTPKVLPNGSVASGLVGTDLFGDPHGVVYRLRRLDSHRFRERWRIAFDALRRAEERLARRGVPLLHFFVARWQPADVHARVAGAGLTAPYLIVPLELTVGRWENPPPYGHGTPEANRRYGRMVYAGLAEELGWPPLPAPEETEEVTLHRGPPPGVDWRGRLDRLSAEATASRIPESFHPSRAARIQVAGALDAGTGVLGRAATVLVRRPPGARRLRIAVHRLDDAPALYPLELTVKIPAPAAETFASFTVPADGPAAHRFTVEIPEELPPGSALDVILVAERAAAAPGSLAPRSLRIGSIEPVLE